MRKDFSPCALLPRQPPEKVISHEGISPSDDMIVHVMDVGANYWSPWNFHEISDKNLATCYQAFPRWFDRINRRIGYRVRPSFIWSYQDHGCQGVIVGFAKTASPPFPAYRGSGWRVKTPGLKERLPRRRLSSLRKDTAGAICIACARNEMAGMEAASGN